MTKSLLLCFFLASIIFLIIDVIWLSITVKTIYRPALGLLINDKPVMWAAALFYIIYVVSLTLIILRPALANESVSQAFWTGAVFGIVTYGTYNLTNMAVLKNWSATVVFVDMFWGGFLTAASATTGVYIAKKIVHI